MATVDKQGTMTMQELLVSSLATADALVKLLIEKGLITEAEFMKKLSAERAGYQAVFQKIGTVEHRAITPELLKEILEAHRKGVETEGREGEKAYLVKANLQGANLREANLQGTKLLTTRGLTARQVKAAKNWELAFYSDDFLKELGFPPDHNERVEKKLAELE